MIFKETIIVTLLFYIYNFSFNKKTKIFDSENRKPYSNLIQVWFWFFLTRLTENWTEFIETTTRQPKTDPNHTRLISQFSRLVAPGEIICHTNRTRDVLTLMPRKREKGKSSSQVIDTEVTSYFRRYRDPAVAPAALSH